MERIHFRSPIILNPHRDHIAPPSPPSSILRHTDQLPPTPSHPLTIPRPPTLHDPSFPNLLPEGEIKRKKKKREGEGERERKNVLLPSIPKLSNETPFAGRLALPP
ncbi:hypothetical protein IE53DRAFT_174079 [Violaceomyces palustris]|uniref:Uncharacterized protein n=1 Tax=Violaceomyces palustris TaxID=1673888 RepID=A0ACD0P5R8_9BASI|nr:hypothetical protein IE53DRAFT_174079 [Violaceomyces palustris]